jgi:leucyl aminopeptidase
MAVAERRSTRPTAAFDPVPSREAAAGLTVDVTTSIPGDATAVAVPVAAAGVVPAELGLSREALAAAGFAGAVGQALPIAGDAVPELVAVGIGDPSALDAAALRDAAAAFARATYRHARIAAELPALGVDDREAAQAVSEGILLARYRYRGFRDQPGEALLEHVAIVADADRADAVRAGVTRGRTAAEAVQVARDLANTPPMHLTAPRFGELARVLGAEAGLRVDVFDNAALVAMGCGGILGVNAGSGDEARLIKLTWTPPGTATGRLALVGKGIMYDAGGISLKPSDAMHAAMKLDMSGAAAVFASMLALRDLGCTSEVTGYLCCTDNMPSGTALRLGDVLTARNGMTVEIFNTDAEGRLVMMDGISLAVEEGVDAIVTIATLTGAAMRTFGDAYAAVLGNDDDLVGQISAAGDTADERVWELPLVKRYRRQLDSKIADIKNMGGENAGTITAGLFLEAFAGDIPFGHLDICGPMMTSVDDSWRSVGATAFGTRLLVELALGFRPPAA